MGGWAHLATREFIRVSFAKSDRSVPSSFFDRLISGAAGRATAAVLAVLLTAATLVAGIGLDAANADSNLTLTATATGNVLAGEAASVTLKANNITSSDLFNLSFRYQLPANVSYAAGSTSPSSLGDPTIDTVTDSTIPLVTHQVLIWSNAADLPIGDEVDLTFGVMPNTTAYPVGGTFAGSAGAYAQADARLVPKFTSGGDVIAGTFTASDTATLGSTAVSALRITKTDPEPEHELMRGVHDHSTLYTLKVQDTAVSPTTGVTVDDYLPAGLEFLGCGAADNSAAGSLEYTGAPRLTVTPAVPACVTPVSVDTVQNPVGYPSGVYTHVVWNLGTIAAGQTKTIVYAAAIPLHYNTMSWPGTTPTAASLGQASNLDNNTGAETRQVAAGQSYTNTATATGTYTGVVAAGSSTTVTSVDSDTVKSMDLSIVKSTTTPDFTSGGDAAFQLLVRTSEYTASSAVKITDVIPNGLCPNLPAGTPVLGGRPIPADCLATGAVSNATVDSVTSNADGTFTVIFTPTVSTAPDASFTIDYTVHDRENYDGAGAEDPTSAGDSFTNNVTIAGTTAVIPALAPLPSESVNDDSSATQVSQAPTISKKILPRTPVSSAADCATHAGSYVSDDPVTPAPSFALGDRVCFELTVNFSSTTETRNARVTDFAPVGSVYEDYALGAASTVPAADVSVPTSTTLPTWNIGHASGAGADLFVDKGQKLVLYVSALVTTVSSSASAVDITANLMKYRQENTAGAVYALRAQANFGIAPASTVSLDKAITAVGGAAIVPAVGTAAAREGLPVDFSLTVKNTGGAATGNNFPVDNASVWDELPAGVACSVVSLITPSGTCVDNARGAGTASRITWLLTGAVAPGASEPVLTYRVTMPTLVSVSSSLVNNASVVHFTSPNTANGDSDFYPTGSLDTSDPTRWNTLPANDAATITTPDAAVVKTGTTLITGTNNTASQAVAGETVNYDYTVTVPANSTVFNGVLSDVLPASLAILGSTVITADIPGSAGLTAGTMPVGYTLSAAGTLTLPATYDNTTAAAQTFTVHLAGVRVSPSAATGALTNTATFQS
ncbi:MAG: hypothetical protein JWR36_874, partial [Glaciihabitans sp.]|nr:hypothetical protein [Glaciihabitans sp.]